MARSGTASAGTRRRETEEQERRRRAARRQVRQVGDPVLRERAREVVRFDGDLVRLAERMIGIMHDAPGIGLAATQLGVLERVLVYDLGEHGPHVLVNPQISERSDETEVHDEGCLSVGNVTVPVERAVAVRVRASDEHGSPLEYSAEGLEARVIQHELDHLDGVLILDRTTRRERARALRELRDAEQPW
jgi:peptide deformylase